jgi:uncharacterized protein YjbJ (UPF0337 family)
MSPLANATRGNRPNRTGTVASNLKGMLGKEPDMDWDGTEGQTKQATSKIKERGGRPCNGELLG